MGLPVIGLWALLATPEVLPGLVFVAGVVSAKVILPVAKVVGKAAVTVAKGVVKAVVVDPVVYTCRAFNTNNTSQSSRTNTNTEEQRNESTEPNDNRSNQRDDNSDKNQNNDDQSDDREDSESESSAENDDDSPEEKKRKLAKKAMKKFLKRILNSIISGAAYYDVYKVFKPTAGALETNHFIPKRSYRNTPYENIIINRMPSIAMLIKDHRFIASTVSHLYRLQLREILRNENFFSALKEELEEMWRTGLIQTYFYDIELMLRYCRDITINGAPNGTLITPDEYDELFALLCYYLEYLFNPETSEFEFSFE
jgi:hypothetical protein